MIELQPQERARFEMLEAFMHPVARGRTLTHQPAEQDPHLNALLSVLNKKATDPGVSAASPTQATVISGWAAYDKGDYMNAQRCFVLGLAAKTAPYLELSATFGLGKVYTRTGHFEASRIWLVKALVLARQWDRCIDLAHLHGAMGELMLRAGHAREAWFHMGCATRLLPHGAKQRQRQHIYMASVLMRLGGAADRTAAEELLMNALFSARDLNDKVSEWHAAARLQALWLDQGKIGDHPAANIELAPGVNNPGAGYLMLGRAIGAALNGQSDTALHLAQVSLQAFGDLRAESRWASLVLAVLENKRSPEWEGVAPDIAAVLPEVQFKEHMRIWSEVELNNDGFALLRTTPALGSSVQAVHALWSLRRPLFL